VIDLHTHLLPGVDDGSRTLETSVRVLERMAAEGVSAVACTPHLNASQVDEAPVEAHARLRAALQAAADESLRALGAEPVQLVAGFEVMLDRPGCELRGKGVSLGGSRAVLVEFPRHGLPSGATEELLRLRAGGMIPVVAHPERYRGVTVDTMHVWRDVGAVIQGDALECFGVPGPTHNAVGREQPAVTPLDCDPNSFMLPEWQGLLQLERAVFVGGFDGDRHDGDS